MGLLDRILGRTEAVVVLAPGRGWTTKVVGESHYQRALQRAYRKHGGTSHDLKLDIILRPDDRNEHDANAVKVEIGGDIVGYLSRDLAVEYRKALGTTAGKCSAKIVGGFEMEGGERASFGVKLNMGWPPRSLQ